MYDYLCQVIRVQYDGKGSVVQQRYFHVSSENAVLDFTRNRRQLALAFIDNILIKILSQVRGACIDKGGTVSLAAVSV